MGSLICALASYLDARANRGRWLLRMEDIDPPRELAGASHAILNSLQAHNLSWDGSVFWQSKQTHRYQTTIDQLLSENLAFRCNCSRRELAASGGVYPGTCRQRYPDLNSEHAVRIKVRAGSSFEVRDSIQSRFQQKLDAEVGDFIIQRRDELFAYQLAVVLDDAEQGVTHVVRGADLYDSTPRQMYLQQVLELPTPDYSHIPLLTNSAGQKLSKQTHALALDDSRPTENLRTALKFLNQDTAITGSLPSLLENAIENWQPGAIKPSPWISESVLS